MARGLRYRAKKSFRLEIGLLVALEKRADDRGITTSDLLRRLVIREVSDNKVTAN